MPSQSSFSAAQERVLQRRREGEAEARNAVSVHHGPGSNLQHASPLRRASGATYRVWNQIRGREGTKPQFRVGQVDAELLDEELLDLFNGQVSEALKYYGSELRDNWSHEIQLALRAILFKLSIWDHNATYGAALQNLKYVDARTKGPVYADPSRWQKALYGLFTVGGRYAWDKWESYLLDQESGWDEPSARHQKFSRLTSMLSTSHSVASFVSFLVFLVNGRYRTLTDRILRMRLSPPSMQVSREVSFEYLNRQLVWHAFTEFLLFLLPLVGISRWRRWLSRAWRRMVSLVKDSAADEDEPQEKQGELSFLPERTCAICYKDQNPAVSTENEVMAASGSGGITGSVHTDIVNPFETMPCGCIYCFVCIAQKLEASEGEGWVCLRCGELVKQCRPWKGDVIEEETQVTNVRSNESSPTKKSVEFAAVNETFHDQNGSTGEEEEEEDDDGDNQEGAYVNHWASDDEEGDEDESDQADRQEYGGFSSGFFEER